MNKALHEGHLRVSPLMALRSLLALLLPALVGILVLLMWSGVNRAAARNLAIRTVGRLGLALSGLRLEVSDPDKLACLRPAIFVFNHQSALDPLLMAAVLQRDISAVVKKELRGQFPVGWLVALAGCSFVDRDAGSGSLALAPAKASLDQGLGLVIAPQGTRRSRVEPGSFRPGALWLASQTGAPLVPVVIQDSRLHLARNGWCIFPGTVRITLHPALPGNATPADLEQPFLDTQRQMTAETVQ